MGAGGRRGAGGAGGSALVEPVAVRISAVVGVPPLVRAWWSRWRFCARAGAGARGGGAGAARGAGAAGAARGERWSSAPAPRRDQSDPPGPWRAAWSSRRWWRGRWRFCASASTVEPVAGRWHWWSRWRSSRRWWSRWRGGGGGGIDGAALVVIGAHEGAVVAHGLAARGAGGDHRAQSDPGGQGAHEGAVVVLVAAITGRTGWRTGWWWR